MNSFHRLKESIAKTKEKRSGKNDTNMIRVLKNLIDLFNAGLGFKTQLCRITISMWQSRRYD